MLTGYAYIPCRPLLPLVKVFIENIGEVIALVDSGASISAIRISVVRKMLPSNRIKSSLKLTGVDNRKVAVDSFLPLKIKWSNRVVELKEVAVVKSCPFAMLLGSDWIIKSKTNLIVENGKIVLKSSDSRSSGIKKVRFAGIEEENFVCNEEANPMLVSDELIESLKQENQPGRRSTGKIVKVVQSTSIPPESLCFVRAKMARDFSGSAMIRANLCANPGSEWVIPCCVVKVESGKLKVPVLNMQTCPINLRRKDFLAFIDSIEVNPDKTIIVQEDQSDMPACTLIHPEEANVWKNARVGENLSAAERDAVFKLLARRRRCFPPDDSNLGSTDMPSTPEMLDQ